MKGHLRVVSPTITILLLWALAGSAEVVNFNNNCDGQIPTNQGYKWFGACPDPIYDETNWEGDILPGPGDIAIIGVEYGPIEVNSYSYNPVVQSVQAPGGLIIDYSSWDLTVTDGFSNITNLQLSNNADFTAGAGAIVYLEGSSRLSADVRGPGIFSNSGTLNVNGCRLWDSAILQNEGTATWSSGSMYLNSGNTTFVNGGTFNMTNSAGELSGESSRIWNDGDMTCSRAGGTVYFDPRYEHSGSLSVVAGTLYFRSVTTFFESGSITISDNAVLQLGNTPFGGDQSYEFSGLSDINGQGLLDIYSDYSVTADLNLSVGTGDPSTGNGNTQLRGTFNLDGGNLSNYGRLRLRNGTIESTSEALFNNYAWAYTTSTGGGTLGISTNNYGNFQVGGGTLTVNNHFFNNESNFTIVAGNVGGSGFFDNVDTFLMEATNPDNVSHVSCHFNNLDTGVVRVTQGHLHFNENLMNLNGGMLNSGNWEAFAPGTLTFPETVTRLFYSSITGPQSSFPNVNPRLVTEGAFKTDAWGFGDLLLDRSTVKAEVGSKNSRDGITVDDTLSIGDSSLAILESGATITAGYIANGIEPPGATPAEIAGEGDPGTSATVVTPLLENRGRIVPGGPDNTGTLHLQGNLVQLANGELKIDLNGAVPGDEYDQLVIDGDATLIGNVTVTSLPDFTPEVGQQFTILTATGTITGTFATVVSTNENSYSLIHDTNSVVLVVEPGGVAVPATDLPDRPTLAAPFPNPFNPHTSIDFSVDRQQQVSVAVYDMSGRRIKLLTDEMYPAGFHAVAWNGRDAAGMAVSSGTYLVRMQAQGVIESRKIVLVR